MHCLKVYCLLYWFYLKYPETITLLGVEEFGIRNSLDWQGFTVSSQGPVAMKQYYRIGDFEILEGLIHNGGPVWKHVSRAVYLFYGILKICIYTFSTAFRLLPR